MTKLTVYKSNKVVEAAYKLSLNEQKIILICIAKHDSNKPLSADDKFTVTASEFAELTQTDINHVYGVLIEVADNLFNRYVVIEHPNPDRPELKKIKTRWISSIGYLSDLATLELSFAVDMLPYLSELKNQFTKYELQNIGGMTSKYGIRLYELLSQYRGIGRREVFIDWLRSHFEIEDNYPVISDFKKRVIDSAVTDINKNSDLNVHAPIYQKSGRKVTSVVFDFKEKQKAATKKINKAKAKQQVEPQPIDNVEHYTEIVKRFGKTDAIVNTIPEEIKVTLKERGVL